MKNRLFLFLGALFLAFPAGAQWSRVAVEGADITSLAVDPLEKGVVYCGTSQGNIYISRDGGNSWESVRPVNQFPGYVVTGLAADVATPGTIRAALAGADRGALVAESHDRGLSWRICARWDHDVNARAIAQSPADPDLIAVGGDDGVYLSRDGGRSWNQTGMGVPGLTLVQSLAWAPKDPNVLFAGTYRQAFRTEDGGKSWVRIADGMVLDATVYSFSFDPRAPGTMWVSTCGWVYKSDNWGSHWTRFTDGFTNRRAPVVRMNPFDGSILYAGTVGGLQRSDDGGKTWKRVTRDTLDVSALEVDPRTGRLLIGTLGEGMYYSDDRGTTLVPASRGLEEARIPVVAADPADRSRVLFLRAYGGPDSGVWDAVNGGARQISSEVPPGAFALAAARFDGTTAWMVASPSILLISRDGGRNFQAPGQPPSGHIRGLFGWPLDAAVVVCDHGVFSSSDGEHFVRASAVTGDPFSAKLVRTAAGEPRLRVTTSDGVFEGDGRHFSFLHRNYLTGGVFRASAEPPEAPLVGYSVANNQLTLTKGDRRRVLELPHSDLDVSDAILAGDGSLYVATMGSGLFRYTPEPPRQEISTEITSADAARR